MSNNIKHHKTEYLNIWHDLFGEWDGQQHLEGAATAEQIEEMMKLLKLRRAQLQKDGEQGTKTDSARCDTLHGNSPRFPLM